MDTCTKRNFFIGIFIGIVAGGAVGYLAGQHAHARDQCEEKNRVTSVKKLLFRAANIASTYLLQLPGRSVEPTTNAITALLDVDTTLPSKSHSPEVILAELGRLGAAVNTCSSGRYFGFVTGGTLPIALAADWLVSTWDQNAWKSLTSPAAAHFESLAVKWLLDLMKLPSTAAGTLCSGATTANIIALTAARDSVLSTCGWDVETNGLIGAPPISIFVGSEAHSSVFKALGIVGLGRGTMNSQRTNTTFIPVDHYGAVCASGLVGLQPPSAPAIVVLQAGHVNTGAFDDFLAVIEWARSGPTDGRGVWVHIDGAFGLWASASAVPARRALAANVELADSWAVDLHKMLNVPYDSAMVAVRDSHTVYSSMSCAAPYTRIPVTSTEPVGSRSSTAVTRSRIQPVVPGLQNSKRARGIVAWATLRQLGKEGIAALVDSCCDHAARFAALLCQDSSKGVTLVHPVLFNQALVRFGSDRRTAAVATAVQEDGRCWVAAAPYRGQTVLRLSVSCWMTTVQDIEFSAKAILEVADRIPS